MTHHIVPSRHDRLHIQVTREEGDDPIRYDPTHVDEDTPKIPDHRGVISHLEAGGDRHLVRPAGDDHREEGIAGE